MRRAEDRAASLAVRDLCQDVVHDVVSEKLFVCMLVLGGAAALRRLVDKPLDVCLNEADGTGSIRSIEMFCKEVEELDDAGMNTLILCYQGTVRFA